MSVPAWLQAPGLWLDQRDPDHARLPELLRAPELGLWVVPLRALDAGDPLGALAQLPLDQVELLPSTAGSCTPDDAVETALLARELLGAERVLLEVAIDAQGRQPDTEGALEAARALRGQGLQLVALCRDDPLACQRLAQLGCVALAPRLPARCGRTQLETIVRTAGVPVIGAGEFETPSQLARLGELGCYGALVGGGLLRAEDPVAMARAMGRGLQAGREARCAASWLVKTPFSR